MADRFRRHPATRIIGHDGREALAGQAGPTVCPCALALDEVLTLGTGFRIGLPGVPQPREDFETLTSGSTGTPRRILRSVESWTASFAVNARLFGIGPGARLGIPGSLSQSLALYGALEGACLGAEVTFLAGLRPDRQAAAIASQGIEVLYATPAQLRALQGDMPDLRLILVGGAKLDAALRAQLARQAFHQRLDLFGKDIVVGHRHRPPLAARKVKEAALHAPHLADRQPVAAPLGRAGIRGVAFEKIGAFDPDLSVADLDLNPRIGRPDRVGRR